MNPKFFKAPSDWRKWLERNHDRAQELWVGFYKRDSGKPSITWPESVDGALCFGWIDGVRKSIDATSYKIRFTPRRPGSIWSAINIKRVAELTKLGLMHVAGLKVFRERDPKKSGRYSFEQKPLQLDPAYVKELRANKKAWIYFQAQPPWYRRTSSFWVMSAKQEETRRRRLARLIDDSEHGRSIAPLTRSKKQA
ncbi:MAG: YdeI/OmpD-associated family protein [bacterium]